MADDYLITKATILLIGLLWVSNKNEKITIIKVTIIILLLELLFSSNYLFNSILLAIFIFVSSYILNKIKNEKQ